MTFRRCGIANRFSKIPRFGPLVTSVTEQQINRDLVKHFGKINTVLNSPSSRDLARHRVTFVSPASKVYPDLSLVAGGLRRDERPESVRQG